MIKFKYLNYDNETLYKLYCQAYSWDKKNYCFPSKESPEFFYLFMKYYGLYEDETFIGFGILNFDISLEPNIFITLNNENLSNKDKEPIQEPRKINIAYIIHPDYRNLGYGSRLVKYLLEKAEEKKDFDLIEVEILKENKASIALIEKYNLDFKYFDDQKIVFQKSIKK